MKYNKEMLGAAVASSFSIRQCLEKLGYIGRSQYHKSVRIAFRKAIGKFNIDISHFRTAKETLQNNQLNKTFSLNDILEGKHPSYQSNHLKLRLLEQSILECVCKICGLGNVWQDLPLTLHLDHINGNPRDHRLSNLRLLCPNCHTQTPTYGFKKRLVP